MPVGAGIGLEALDAGGETEIDPVVLVETGAHRAHLGAERSFEGDRQGLDDGHVEITFATAGGDLGADEACTDHDDAARPAVEGSTDGDGVVEGAQHVHAGDVVGAGEGSGRCTGGHDELVEGEVLVAAGSGDHHATGVEVERHRPGAEMPVDVEILGRRREHDPVDVPGPGEHLLRQGRPVVGSVRFGVDDGEAP